MQRPTNAPVRVVLVGAGHAHAMALREFGRRPLAGARVTLITAGPRTPYSGMLPGLVTGYYGEADIHIDTPSLARFAGADLVLAKADGMDLKARQVRLADGNTVGFDVLSLDIGSTPGGRDLPGVAERAIPVKPIDGFLSHFARARETVLSAAGRLTVAVVGGGAAGVELSLALATRLRADTERAGGSPETIRLQIVTAAPGLVPEFPVGARARLERIVAARGIGVRAGARVTGLDAGALQIAGGRPEPADLVFWVTDASAAPWLRQTGLSLDRKGFIEVSDTLQSTSHPTVLAAGDVASIAGHRVPKSGVYAVRQGAVIAENLRRLVEAHPLRRYVPQRNALYLVSTGGRYAVGVRNGLSVEGAWVWRIKDWIDRRFMAGFRFN